jgi:hypothetical protein
MGEIAVQSINMQADAKPIQSILAGTGKLSAETIKRRTAGPGLSKRVRSELPLDAMGRQWAVAKRGA